MYMSSLLRLAVLSALFLSVAFPQTNPPCDRTIAGSMAEAYFRRNMATKIVHPVYPKEAVAARVTGLVVADVCVAAGSDKATVIRVLTAPNAVIGEAVRSAISQWRFRLNWWASDPERPHAFASKVVYYFVERDGQFLVLKPDDEFYVGPEFALKQQSVKFRK